MVGILNTRKLLLSPDDDVSEAIEFPSFVPSTMNLMNLLQSLQKQRRGLAIVLDEFGTTAGLVTLEDILADIVGGLRREGGASQFVLEEQGQGRWRMTGNVWLEDFRREYPALERAPGVDTIGGLVTSQLDSIPAVDTVVEFSGLTFRVTRADTRRVLEVVAQTRGGKG